MRSLAKLSFSKGGQVRRGGVLFSSVLACTGGCSEPESGSNVDANGRLTQALAQDFEGVYSLTARTTNLSACEPGPSSLDTTSDLSFVLVASRVLGQPTLELVSCKPETCADVAQKTKALTIVGSEYRYSFTGSGSPDTVTGFIAWSGADNGSGTCTERSFDEFTLTRSSDALHLDRTTKGLRDAPAEEGFCFADPEKEKQEAASAPCTEMETLDAIWSAELP